MEKLTFRTNIKCSGCVAKATPYLNQAVGEDNWEVDISQPEKWLTIESDGPVDKQAVINAVKQAGYDASEE